MRSVDARFFLRVWQDGRRGEGMRASLRELATGATHHFGDLDQLRRHLEALDGGAAAAPPTTDDSE